MVLKDGASGNEVAAHLEWFGGLIHQARLAGMGYSSEEKAQ